VHALVEGEGWMCEWVCVCNHNLAVCPVGLCRSVWPGRLKLNEDTEMSECGHYEAHTFVSCWNISPYKWIASCGIHFWSSLTCTQADSIYTVDCMPTIKSWIWSICILLF
jgi:hypothetical protein